MTRLRLLVLHVRSAVNATLSYQYGWLEALERDPRFDVDAVNLARTAELLALRLRGRRVERADAIVMLHSVFSNERALSPQLAARLVRARPPKALFVGNEYKLMPEKLAFAEETDVSLLVSQLSSPAAHGLYRERLGCAVVGIPNTGFDPAVFAPVRPRAERPVDIGYRAHRSPLYLGHDERGELAAHVEEAAARHGLVADVSLDPVDRFDQSGWADFLNRCRAQAGSEAGGDRFELDDATRLAVSADGDLAPNPSLAAVRERHFAETSRDVSGRALSGRVVEAAATKTVQVLLEGEYGGFFRPDVHYLPLRKDFANLDDVFGRLRDEAECARLVDAAYEVALAELTYERLLDRFHDALLPVVA